MSGPRRTAAAPGPSAPKGPEPGSEVPEVIAREERVHDLLIGHAVDIAGIERCIGRRDAARGQCPVDHGPERRQAPLGPPLRTALRARQ